MGALDELIITVHPKRYIKEGGLLKEKLVWLLPLVFVLLAGILGIDFLLHGTPWGKSSFREEVSQYLQTQYKMSSGYQQDVAYGFKEGRYTSYITLSNGLRFTITKDDSDSITDSYLDTLIGNQLEETVTKEVSLLFPTHPMSQVRVNAFIGRQKQDFPNITVDHLPPYQELPPDFKKSTQVSIKLEVGNESDEEVLQKLVSFVQWLRENKYYSDYMVSWNNRQLDFDQRQIDNVQTSQDLQKRMTNNI